MFPKLFNVDEKTNDRIWMAWIIVLVVGLVGTLLGVQFPVPPLPGQDLGDVGAQGVTNLDMLHLAAPTTVATATPALMVDCAGLGTCFEIRDASTPVVTINDGGVLDLQGNKLELDADADTSITADTDDQIDVEIGGADIIVANEWGAATIATTTTVNLVEIIDSSPVISTGGTVALAALNIDLGIGNSVAGTNSVYGLLIDSISQDAQNTEAAISVGSGWDTGLDLGTNTLLNVGNAGTDFTATGGLNLAGELDLAGLFQPSFANLAVSDGDTITATYTVYALDTSGAVTVTLAASADEGQLLVLINDDANATIIADTNLRSSDGNAITLAGALDVVVFVYQDSEWLELLAIANS